MVPDILKNVAPVEIKNVFSSGITSGGLTAIFLSLVLPGRKPELETVADSPAEDSDV